MGTVQMYIYFEPNDASSQQLTRLSRHWHGRYATVTVEYVVDLLPPVVSLELWLRLSTAISLPALYGQSE